MATATKEYLKTLELTDFSYSSILDCKTKLLDIFVKIIPKGKIGIYGEYQVYVFYKKGSSNRKNDNYNVRVVRKSFCDIIDCQEETEQEISIEKIKFEPACKFILDKRNHFSKLQVEGLLEVSYLSNEIRKEEDNMEAEEKSSEEHTSSEAEEIDEEEKVLQFDDEKFSIEEMMNMDLNQLKQIAKKEE